MTLHDDRFAAAAALADAVMMEGYALYPYRASSAKNRFRWTFGLLAPRAWSEAGGCEPWWLEAQVLVAGAPSQIAGRLRFFQIERRRTGDAEGGARSRGGDARARAGDEVPVWDEGVVRGVDFAVPEAAGEAACAFAFDGVRRATADGRGSRAQHALAGRIAIRREVVPAERPLARITVRVENITPWSEPGAPRDRVLAAALAQAHLLLGATGGELISAIDPPAWASARCTCIRTYPVLVGPPGSHDVMLCAPFILYDHPQLAPESVTDLCDATEIDELLLLRIRTLTDDEKREARATDPRVAAILDRADALDAGALARLHGAARGLVAGEMAPSPGSPVGRKVRLRAPTRPSDAQDLLYAGHVATVVGVRHDVDGTEFLAVTIDDDPAAELHGWYGRYHYYRHDEVDLL